MSTTRTAIIPAIDAGVRGRAVVVGGSFGVVPALAALCGGRRS
ncbi:hypothetical protein [Georgenia subflava]|nr:hypothetical protein [Georgenia subflava]